MVRGISLGTVHAAGTYRASSLAAYTRSCYSYVLVFRCVKTCSRWFGVRTVVKGTTLELNLGEETRIDGY